MNHNPFLVPPGQKISLAQYDPAYTGNFQHKREAREKLAADIERLKALQDVFYAQDNYSLLIILQAPDAAGKDGAIKHVMSGVNPQGCQVFSFKKPSDEELDHDFLWRCLKRLPERGRFGIFNRSYYEEVLIVRVHPAILAGQKLPPSRLGPDIWQNRFEDINNVEQYLARNGTIILKFFLNLSKEEQKRRFLSRIETPEKNWKFSIADSRERGFWDEYRAAYEDCFNHTSTEWAPWHIIPADHKWFSRAAIAEIIVKKLESLNLAYPTLGPDKLVELERAREALLSEDA
jgi:PPK2 family polyphosphate:nucleotide phosphotransferase